MVAACDTTIYHNEHEPMSIKAGENIPDGWTVNPSTLTVMWKNNRDGSWIKTPVKE